MIEGSADFLPEEVIIEGLRLGHEAIKTICRALAEWGAKVGKPKRTADLRVPPPELKGLLKEEYGAMIDEAIRTSGRNAESPRLREIDGMIQEK